MPLDLQHWALKSQWDEAEFVFLVRKEGFFRLQIFNSTTKSPKHLSHANYFFFFLWLLPQTQGKLFFVLSSLVWTRLPMLLFHPFLTSYTRENGLYYQPVSFCSHEQFFPPWELSSEASCDVSKFTAEKCASWNVSVICSSSSEHSRLMLLLFRSFLKMLHRNNYDF